MKKIAAFEDPQKRRLALLLVICAVQLAAVFGYIFFYRAHGYLPSPFLDDKNDTFMDFFNPMFWADRDGRYTEWGSVYPPLNFLLLKIVHALTLGNVVTANPFALRDTGLPCIIFLVGAYLCIPAFVVTRQSWQHFSRWEKVLIYVAAICSPLMLFTLERGNIILVALIVVPLLFSPSPWVRPIALAFLVNLKPYFAPLFFIYLVTQRWKEWAVGTAVAVAIYFSTCWLLDASIFALPTNALHFALKNEAFSVRATLVMASSISVFSHALDAGISPFGFRVDPDFTGTLIEALKWAVEAVAFVALVQARKVLSLSALFAMGIIMILNASVSVGGYTLIFYFALLPILMEMKGRAFYITSVILMALPISQIVFVHSDLGAQFSYLSGRLVDVYWTVGLGTYLRPVLDLVLLAVLAKEFLSCSMSTHEVIEIDMPTVRKN